MCDRKKNARKNKSHLNFVFVFLGRRSAHVAGAYATGSSLLASFCETDCVDLCLNANKFCNNNERIMSKCLLILFV